MPYDQAFHKAAYLDHSYILLYTADIPTTEDTFIATYADDTAILTTSTDPGTTSNKLQERNNLTLFKTGSMLTKQNLLIIKKITCPTVYLYSNIIPL